MVSPEEYFYYLRKAFKNNHIHGQDLTETIYGLWLLP